MKPSQEQTVDIVCGVVSNVIEDWGLDATLSPETCLVSELGFTSMDMIDVVSTLETQLRRKLPYEELVMLPEGGYREDISIGELATFVYDNYDVTRTEAGAI